MYEGNIFYSISCITRACFPPVGQIPGFEKLETLKTLRKCDQHDSSLNDLTF